MKQQVAYKQNAAQRAFSLVELLVVIAITSIILGLLFGPIISSFNLTRKARAQAQAQDAARFGLERLSRELGRATYIYDNGLAPVLIPMNYVGVRTDASNQAAIINVGGATFADMVQGATPGDPEKRSSLVAYGRIDLVQAAVRQNPGDVIDPTTGQPVGGSELQPGVRGKRVTRYFLGLRFPGINPKTGNQRLYTNIYEFRNNRAPLAEENLEAGSLNPVILYRAEYDPTDPNLFNTDPAAYASTTVNAGGFNDPAFFYGTGTAANGNTYGENWQAIAQPVLTSENLDLLRWNRVGRPTERDIKDARDPFAATTTFTPTAQVDDVAAPGFLSSGGVETPAAVPASYQTKFGAWTYPYTITVLRGSTNYNPAGRTAPTGSTGAEPFGTMTITVNRDTGGNIFVSRLVAPANFGDPAKPNTLATAPGTDLYTIFSPSSRKLFVKTPNLTFAIDPDRGRVETAFPPLRGRAGTGNGVPSFYVNGSNVIADAVPIPVPGNVTNIGELVPIRFVQDTRDPLAGGTIPAGTVLADGGPTPVAVPVATNQGLRSLDFFDRAATRYQLADGLTNVGAGTPLISPLVTFGVESGGVQRGIRIIPGSERVNAPVVNGGADTSWGRVSALGQLEQLVPTVVPGALPYTYKTVPERRSQYVFDFDLLPLANTASLEQRVVFDVRVQSTAAAGLPAADVLGRNYVTGTYLWQNNYSRDPLSTSPTWGYPLDARTNAVGSVLPLGLTEGSRPEADIFRVDYATRQIYNINLGARIYDPTDGRVSSIQVSDKVIINNALR